MKRPPRYGGLESRPGLRSGIMRYVSTPDRSSRHIAASSPRSATEWSIRNRMLERRGDSAPRLEVDRGCALTQRRAPCQLAARTAAGVDLEQVVHVQTLAFATGHQHELISADQRAQKAPGTLERQVPY